MDVFGNAALGADAMDLHRAETKATSPVVSIVIANYNGQAYLTDCLTSALRQSIEHLEIIVIDDGSTDGSVDIVRQRAAADTRITLIETSGRSGPGAARNHGLASARGTWIAILDSDDLMHPRRLKDLIEHAIRSDADIVADNQIVFDNNRVKPPKPLLKGSEIPSDHNITIEAYIRSNCLFSRSAPLGYLKPIFRRSFLQASGCLYDPTLTIAEDYDLVVRLLIRGARFIIHPALTYFYRRHSGSISHRLSERTLSPMLASDRALRLANSTSEEHFGPSVVAALDYRRRSIERALQFDTLVTLLTTRAWGRALRYAMAHPHVAALLRIPLRDRISRMRRGKRQPPQGSGRRVTLISRQRVVGTTNGSSVYLLSLCGSLRQAGYAIDLVSPSPAMFGRWPYLRLDPSMDVFDQIRIRGSLRIGRLVVALDPGISLRAAAGLADRLLSRMGIKIEQLGRKAPHAIAVPLTDADRLFLAEAVQPSTFLLVDYAFLTDAIPFALQPTTRSAVVMHDLFSAQDPGRAVVTLELDEEIALLDQADAVVTIQAEETAVIKAHMPDKRVILAPMATRTVACAQPGQDGTVLFVGSNTLPNLDAINWLIKDVWPEVIKSRPGARLQVAGSCCVGVTGGSEGVELLGRVDNLDKIYTTAGVVVSPLRLGTGLKIKLVEALGHGKAVIATETTLQGVKSMLTKSVRQADTKDGFVAALLDLLDDGSERRCLGERALMAAKQYFSAEACYSELLSFAAAGSNDVH
jgi:succinoglycan biosynthesis protein ExoO